MANVSATQLLVKSDLTSIKHEYVMLMRLTANKTFHLKCRSVKTQIKYLIFAKFLLFMKLILQFS